MAEEAGISDERLEEIKIEHYNRKIGNAASQSKVGKQADSS